MKITNKFAILVVAFGILSVSFIEDGLKKLIPGKGIAGELVIGETTRAEIEKKYGSDFKELTYYTKKNQDSVLYSTALYFEKQGLKFYYQPASTGLSSALFYKNFPAVSDKGIRAGISTMKEVIAAYGESEWYTSGRTMFLEYDGIEFHIPFDGKYPIKKSVYKKAKNMVVEYISIDASEVVQETLDK
ncbi:MAG: hypothetical protein M3R17_08095 [Bacteroidota bacterium]|nr:hypothetical protein [Bacteroidota bacterium]